MSRSTSLVCLLVCFVGASVAAQSIVRVAQESSPGAGDFDTSILGCFEVFNVPTSSVGYFSYAASSYNGPAPVAVAQRSQVFLASAIDGLTLFIVHDAIGDPDGGTAQMQIDVLGDPDGLARTVSDDPGDGYTPGLGVSSFGFTSNHVWLPCCTDGMAFASLDGAWEVFASFTATPTGMTEWQVASADGSSIALSMEVNRRIRIDACQGALPSCRVLSPMPMDQLSDVVSLDFSADDPQGDPLLVVFDWSSDSGATWTPATAGPTSPLSNPTLGLATPAPLETFRWDSIFDAVGLGVPQPVTLRVTVSDGFSNASCTVDVEVDNSNPCRIGFLSCGDCDADHFVNVLDALRLASIAAGLADQPVPGSVYFNACNVQGSAYPDPMASLSISDALVVARHVVGLSGLGCCAP